MSQTDWDSMLIGAFRRSWTARRGDHMQDLVDRYNMAFDDYDSLIRRPRYRGFYRMSVCRFVCAYLPTWIRDAMIDGMERGELLARLAASNADVDHLQNPGERAEAREVDRTRMEYRAAYMSMSAEGEARHSLSGKIGGKFCGPVYRGGRSI